MKIKLAWRIGLLPLSLLAIPLFVGIGIGMGIEAWYAAVKKFWRSEI